MLPLNFIKLKHFTYYLLITIVILTLSCTSNQLDSKQPQPEKVSPQETPITVNLSKDELIVMDFIKDAERAIAAHEFLIKRLAQIEDFETSIIEIRNLNGDQPFLTRDKASLPTKLQKAQEKLQDAKNKWYELIPNMEKLQNRQKEQSTTIEYVKQDNIDTYNSAFGSYLEAKETIQTLKQIVLAGKYVSEQNLEEKNVTEQPAKKAKEATIDPEKQAAAIYKAQENLVNKFLQEVSKGKNVGHYSCDRLTSFPEFSDVSNWEIIKHRDNTPEVVIRFEKSPKVSGRTTTQQVYTFTVSRSLTPCVNLIHAGL